jgi:hypothetical protein
MVLKPRVWPVRVRAVPPRSPSDGMGDIFRTGAGFFCWLSAGPDRADDDIFLRLEPASV